MNGNNLLDSMLDCKIKHAVKKMQKKIFKGFVQGSQGPQDDTMPKISS